MIVGDADGADQQGDDSRHADEDAEARVEEVHQAEELCEVEPLDRVGIVGPNAGDLIAEIGLAIEMGADAADIGLTVHPHPTLSETVAFAAEAQEGTLTDLYMPKKT